MTRQLQQLWDWAERKAMEPELGWTGTFVILSPFLALAALALVLSAIGGLLDRL